MKTQKQVIKYIKKNYSFWIKVIAILAFAYGIKKYFFTKDLTIDKLFQEVYLVKLYKIFNIKIDKKNKTLTNNNNTISYHNINGHIPKKIIGNKKVINDLLLKNNMPVCKNIRWNDNISDTQNIKIINKEMKFPIVIKPIYGKQGYGVKTDINDNEFLLKNIKALKKNKGKKIKIKKGIIIEEQEIGEKYRIFILNGKIIYVKHDTIPIIIGNGTTSIRNLIKNYHITNKNVKPIVHINEDLILNQGYSLDSILENNKQIKVASSISRGNGSKDIMIELSKVHPDNLKMFIETSKIIRYNLCGIDYVTKDLNTPYHIYGKIIEVNSEPGINETMVKNTSIFKRLVDALFSPRMYN